jgi:putative tricarboxylic transport membrane protein
MKTPETIISLVLISTGLLFCFFSLRVGIGRINNPGPGFIPLISGCVLIVLSVCTMLFEGKPGRKEQSEPKTFKGMGSSLLLPVSVLCSLLVYALVLEILGFVLSTFLFLTFLFMTSKKRNWKVALGASILITVCTCLLFGYLLDVELPQGFLGF